MSEFFRLIRRDNLVDNSFVADAWDLKCHERNDFCCGQEIPNWPNEISFQASKRDMEGDLDDFVVNDAMVPLVTKRLLDLINALKAPAFQALPADAIWCSGRRERVFILNFTKLIPGLDMRNTRIERYPNDYPNPQKRGKIWVIMTPVLLRRAVLGWDLFRCEGYPDELFASNGFRDRFNRAAMTGVAFDPVNLS